MSTRCSIVEAIPVGATVVGVGECASAGGTAMPTATTTRRFWIDNLTSSPLQVMDAYGINPCYDGLKSNPRDMPCDHRQALLPDDLVPTGATIAPGGHITVEVVSRWAGHEIIVTLGHGPDRAGSIDVRLGVHRNTRTSYAWSDAHQAIAGGQDITIR